jgi:hypothetical protein
LSYVYFVGLNGFWMQQVATMLKLLGRLERNIQEEPYDQEV